ncbi:MAG: mechanosensitive ion channel family protein [Clostridia bacterium]
MNINEILITAGMRMLIALGVSIILQIIIYALNKREKNLRKKTPLFYITDALGFYPFLWITGIAAYNAYGLVKMPFPEVAQADKRKIVVILAILTIAYIIIRMITKYLTTSPKYLKGKLQSTGIFVNSIKIITLVIVALIVLNVLEIPITPLITALGVGSALLALTLQETLANFLSGFYMASSLQFKPGDYIKVTDSDIQGTVTDILWRYTIIKDISGNHNTVPNSVLAKATLVNYSQPSNEYFFSAPIKLSIDNNSEMVVSILEEVVQYVVENFQFCPKDYIPTPRIRSVGFNYAEYSIWFKVNGYTNKYALKDLYYKTLLVELKKHNIETPRIPYELYDAKVKEIHS